MLTVLTSPVPRVVRPPLNVLLGPGPFSHKKAPGPGVRGLEAPRLSDIRETFLKKIVPGGRGA